MNRTALLASLACIALAAACGGTASSRDVAGSDDLPPVVIGHDLGHDVRKDAATDAIHDAAKDAADAAKPADVADPGDPGDAPEVPAGDVPCDDACDVTVCEPGLTACTPGGIATRCSADGTTLQTEDCLSKGLACQAGACVPCEPGFAACEGNKRRYCRPDGTLALEDCGALTCTGGKCVFCTPGEAGCYNGNASKCAADGGGWELVQACDPEGAGLICKAGACVSMCDQQGPRTNAGCEYWPLDLDQNYEYDAENQQFAVIVSNLSSQFSAKVTVFKDGLVEKEVTVPKNDLAIIPLDPYNIDTAGVATPERLLSRRLKSTIPIVAYQFSPLENVGVFSNDASLLLPTNALGRTYRVVSWQQRGDDIASYFTLLPVEEGDTTVTLTVAAPTVAGPGLDALPAGGSTTLTLKQGQVVHVKATGTCVDLTGSLVQADKRLAVMGGHECANVPNSNGCSTVFCCCDHLEEQLFPTDAWGKHYLVGRLFPRGSATDTVRVLASQDGTHVTVTGAAVTVPVLDAGKYFDFQVSAHVDIQADKPVGVAQYMEGQTSPTGCDQTCDDTLIFGMTCDGIPFGKSCSTDADCCPGVAGIGDPSLILAVPVEQFREDYVFLVPTKYALSYVNVVAPAGATVDLDGAAIDPSAFQPAPGGQYAVATQAVTEGVHRLSSSSRLGVVVYGWDQYVSYGYAGGMNVNTLTGP